MRANRRRNQRQRRARRSMILAVVHDGQIRARRVTLSREGVPYDALLCPKLRIFFFPWKKDPNKQSIPLHGPTASYAQALGRLKREALAAPATSAKIELREHQKKAIEETKKIVGTGPAKKAAPKKPTK